ncbi:MAG: hypothetical protein JRS35_16565 [Deltaproteobacteria bacterium]|nr:hypothetical protein [Deltaproteobacteria bacterium]
MRFFLALAVLITAPAPALAGDVFGLKWGMSQADVSELIPIEPQPHAAGKRFGAAYWGRSLPIPGGDQGVVLMQFGFTDQLVRFLVTFGKYEEDNYFYEGSHHDPKEDPPRGYWVKDFRWARKKFEELVDVVAKDYAPIDCDKPRLKYKPMPGLFHQKQLDENLQGIEGLWYCHFGRGPTMVSVAIVSRGVWNFQDFYEVVIVAQNPELAMDSRREARRIRDELEAAQDQGEAAEEVRAPAGDSPPEASGQQ